MERAVRVLLVDTDEERRTQTVTTLEDAFSDWSFAVDSTVGGALTRLESGPVDILISSARLEDGSGLDLLHRIREANRRTPFILSAETISDDQLVELYEREYTEYVPANLGSEAILTKRLETLSHTQTLESGQYPPEHGQPVAEDNSTTTDNQPVAENGSTVTDTEELARERERFSDLFSNFPEPTVAYGFQNGVTVFKTVNDAFEDVFGRTEEGVKDDSINELLVPEDHRDESEEIDNQVDTGDMVDRVVRRVAADGQRIFNLRSIPVSTEGEIDGFAIYSDITDRKRREQELERYETIVKTIPMGVVTVEHDWQIGNINAQGAEILGYEVQELIGEPFITLQRDGVISGDETGLAEDVVEQLYAAGGDEKSVVEVTIAPEPDVTRELEVHTSLLSAASDDPGVVLVFHDISDRKENERQLKRQNERLEEFASIVSHDLRNPLNVAMGHLEIVKDQHQGDSVTRIAVALDRMETLIHETLQLAKQGQTVTETQQIQLEELVAGCWTMIDQKEATLEQDGDIRFRGDPSRVKQLFENLFRNAIEHGGTAVHIRVGVENGVITVSDNGPGIPPEKREDVFETGHTTSKDGTGFGLAIVQEIVDAHDWTIRVTESEQGGARFEISDFGVTTDQ